jgi:hypothetical protein
MPYNHACATYMRHAHGQQFVVGLLDMLQQLPERMVMAEVGIFAGESTRLFLASGKVEHLFAVDPWAGDYEQDNGLWQCPFAWADVRDTFAAYAAQRSEITTLEMLSLDAAKNFKAGSLDFVYIDGNHGYRAVRDDLLAWRPKVRAGGFLGGHDLSEVFPGVAQALLDTKIGWRWKFADTSWLVQV